MRAARVSQRHFVRCTRSVSHTRYDNPDVALNTGQILHELLRHETLAKLLLNSGHVYDFKDYIERTTFGIACDAMTSFKELTTKHKPMVADYLERNYDDVSRRVCAQFNPAESLPSVLRDDE